MKEQIERILDSIRPNILMHGGNVALVDVDEKKGIVKVALQGACVNCSLSSVTLKHGIEESIKMEFPQIKEVVSV